MLTKVVLVLAVFLFADERQELLKALYDAELKLELAKRSVPAELDIARERRFVDTVAQRLGFALDVKVLPSVEAVGELALHWLEVSGTYENLRNFLSLLAVRDTRAGDLETLHADGKRFTARFVLPVFVGSQRSTDLRRELERIRATQAAIERMNWTRLRDTSALLDVELPRSVRVTGVRIDGETSIEGVLAGAAARKSLLANIAKAGFAVPRLRMSPSGACRSFALTARRGAAETQTAFDLAPSPLCRVDAEPRAGRISAKGSKGDLTFRFRDIDLADLFFVLHDLTGASFVVDANVKGAVEVDVEKATLDEVLSAMRGTGLVIGSGPLRRVSRPDAAPPQSKGYIGEPVSLILSEALLRDILCLYKEITGLEFRTALGLATRVSVYVKDRPWDETLDLLLAGAGLRYTIDGARVLVGENATASACQGFASSSFSDFRPKLEELGAADLTLAGVAGTKAYVYGPWRKLLVLEPGARVYDGAVKSIAMNGVRFTMDGGLVFDLPL